MFKRKLSITLLLVAMLIATGSPLVAAKVLPSPTVIPGNPRCSDINPAWSELKVDPPNNGIFNDGILYATITNSDGTYFNWSSNIGVDAVLVKGGPNANLYQYDPPTEAFSGAGLHSPINPSNGKPYELSHINFCYDIETTVPEFPTVALPVGLAIGMAFVIYNLKRQ